MRTRPSLLALGSLVLLAAGCSFTTSTTPPVSSAPAASVAPSTPVPPSTAVPSSVATSDNPAVPVGMAVLANHTGDQWYPASIVSAKSGIYTVHYDSKDVADEKLPATKLAKLPTGAQRVKVGDKVVAKWLPTTWWNATVAVVDGSKVSVVYSDRTGQDVTTSDVAFPMEGTVNSVDVPTAAPSAAPSSVMAPSAAGSKEPTATKEVPFPVGMSILANWKSGQAWYPGKIVAAKGGTYDVDYQDGSKETGLTIEKLAYFPGGPQVVKVGDSVIAEWRPATWWGAKVTAVEGDMVSILYSDNTTGKLKNTQFTRPGPSK